MNKVDVRHIQHVEMQPVNAPQRANEAQIKALQLSPVQPSEEVGTLTYLACLFSFFIQCIQAYLNCLSDPQADFEQAVENKDLIRAGALHTTRGVNINNVDRWVPAPYQVTTPHGELRSSGAYASLLHQAAAKGDVQTARFLIEHGASTASLDNRGNTPLHWAMYVGSEEMVALLLTHGADVNAANENGQTPLILAAERGHEPIVRLLLANSASPNLGDHFAQFSGTVLELIQQGRLNPNAHFPGEPSLLEQAYVAGQLDVAMQLIQLGADITTPFVGEEFLGQTIVHRLAMNDQNLALLKQIASLVSLTKKDNLGRTPLHIAMGSGAVQCANAILERGPLLINFRDEMGYTPLHHAVIANNSQAVNLCLAYNADINAGDNLDWTPLHSASCCGHASIVQILCHQQGIQVNAVARRGKTPLHLAARENVQYPEIVRILRAHGAMTVPDVSGRLPNTAMDDYVDTAVSVTSQAALFVAGLWNTVTGPYRGEASSSAPMTDAFTLF